MRGVIIAIQNHQAVAAWSCMYGLIRPYMLERQPPQWPYLIDFEATPPGAALAHLMPAALNVNDNHSQRVQWPDPMDILLPAPWNAPQQ